ncbi:MAG: hypothetical protein IT406_01740 [Candidatus Yanofskybacteria bacterium]|nr:hypothetical protein [Candidatus Yanofskybacteria bacterium]
MKAIEERKQEARDKKIEEKARLIVQQLGKERLRYYFGASERIVEFERDGLRVATSSAFIVAGGFLFQVTIHASESLVFSKTAQEIECFVPGDWEAVLNTLWFEAKERTEVAAKAETQKAEAEAAAKRAKWGL